MGTFCRGTLCCTKKFWNMPTLFCAAECPPAGRPQPRMKLITGVKYFTVKLIIIEGHQYCQAKKDGLSGMGREIIPPSPRA